MQAGTNNKRPNARLRYEREARGWTQQYVAEHLGADMNIVSRWECGERKPGPYYRQKLIELFGKSSVELGLVEVKAPPALSLDARPQLATQQATVPDAPSSEVLVDNSLDTHTVKTVYSPPIKTQTSLISGSGNPQGVASVATPLRLPEVHHSLDILQENTEGTPEQRLGAWLALGASDLAQLFEEGWTLEEVFTSLQMLQKAVQIVSKITRRQLFHLGALALVSGIPIPTGKHISVEERTALHQALSECIESGWKLFVTTSMPQVLVVGQAQLQLLNQVYAELYPSVRPLFYSPVYRLIGAALFFQSRYREALQAHHQAYLTALEAGDAWNMSESLSWQAGVYKACGRHPESIQTTEAALRLLKGFQETHAVAAQARMLAHWAESAALLGERAIMEEKLAESAELLSQFDGNDEFDDAIWHLYHGTCALYIGDPGRAEQSLKRALQKLNPNLLHQRASATLLLSQAQFKMGEWEGALKVAREALPLVVATNSPLLDRGLVDLVEHCMIPLARDVEVKDLVESVQQHPRLHTIHMQHHVPRYLEATL